MQAAIRDYLHQLEYDQHASEHTIQAYRTDLQQFLAVIKAQSGTGIAPGELSEALIQRYSDWLHDQGYKQSTISRKFAALRSFLQYLHDVGLREEVGPIGGLKVPYRPRKIPRMLNHDELNRLLAAPRSSRTPGGLRDAAILDLLYEGGLRATELVNLRLADVHLSQARLRHPSHSNESISIPGSIESIRSYLQDGRPHLVRDPFEDVLFLNQRGKGLTRQGLWLVVKRWAASAGIKGALSPHTLRHTRARDLLDRGVNRREVQRFLGLSSPNAIRIHSKTRDGED